MSGRKAGAGGFAPTGQAGGQLSISDLERILTLFERLTNNPTIKWSIYAAGVGAVLETLHIIWLAARYLVKF
jgi:hypothetical protein